MERIESFITVYKWINFFHVWLTLGLVEQIPHEFTLLVVKLATDIGRAFLVLPCRQRSPTSINYVQSVFPLKQ